MEEVYKHLVESEGEESAKKLIHYMYSFLKIPTMQIEYHMIHDFKGMAMEIGYQNALEEIAYLYRMTLSFEDFLEKVNESEYNNIILDFEQWDNRQPQIKFYETIRALERQTE